MRHRREEVEEEGEENADWKKGGRGEAWPSSGAVCRLTAKQAHSVAQRIHLRDSS